MLLPNLNPNLDSIAENFQLLLNYQKIVLLAALQPPELRVSFLSSLGRSVRTKKFRDLAIESFDRFLDL